MTTTRLGVGGYPVSSETGESTMANFQAYNDRVWTLPALTLINPATGDPVSTSGIPFTVTSSKPSSLGVGFAVLPLNSTNIVLTPLVQNSPGITVTVSSPGLTSASFLVDVVTDPNAPDQIVVDSNQADATSIGQNVPTAPGP